MDNITYKKLEEISDITEKHRTKDWIKTDMWKISCLIADIINFGNK